MGPLNLKLILQAVDRASGPTNKVTGAVGGLLGRVTTLGRRMNKLTLAGGAIAAAGAAVASVALARSALGMVREAADAGDAAIKTAQKVGLGVVAFQRYAWAANLAGVEQAGLVTGLGLLAQKADGAARGGKEDLKIFARLGISSRRLAGDLKSPGALLEYLADRFAAMPDGATKTAMAMDLFGRSGRDLIPLLNGGGAAMRAAGDEAERLGQVIDEKTGKAAEEFNDNVSRMKGAVAGLRLGIGGALLPTLNSAVVGITAWIGAHRAEILDKVNIAVGRLAAGLSKVDWIKFAEGVGNTIIGAVKLFEWFGGLDGLVTGGLVLGIGKLTLGLVGIAPAIAGMIGVAAGPVGWILLAVGALAAGAVLLWRNWDQVAGWFGGMWSRIKTTFTEGTTAVWNALPGWLRFILKGAAFVVRFASPVGMGQAVTAAAGAAGVRQQPATPRAAVGRAADGRVAVDIKVDQDGQVRGVQSRTEGRGVWADMVRGSAMAAF